MKKNIFILILSLTTLSSNSQSIGMRKLKSVVKDIQTISQKDNGKFWGIKYETPLLFVNPENRQTFVFDIGKKPYMIQLEDTIPIGNTRSYWNGKHWAMIGLPLPEHPFMYETLILHEMFHALQPQLDFVALYEMPCAHLEKEKGAVFLRLELQALLKATEQRNSKDSLYKHLNSALIFRNSRYAIYPNAKEEENAMELNEGLAEYTMFMMAHRYSKNKISDEKLTKLFQAYLSFDEQDERLSARSFAYTTILFYGYLIQMDFPYWHHKVTKQTNLTDFFMQLMEMSSNEEEIIIMPQNNETETVIIKFNGNDNNELNINMSNDEGMITFVFNANEVETNMDNEEWLSLAFQYNYENIAKEERIRFEQKNAEKNDTKTRLLCENHMELPLFEFNYSFNPFNIMSIEDVGVYYGEITIYDSWGKVEVSNGLILDNKNKKAFLSPMVKREDNIIIGDGWKLILNAGWDVISKENFMVIQNR